MGDIVDSDPLTEYKVDPDPMYADADPDPMYADADPEVGVLPTE
jgi:hypothetical protein